MKDITGQRFGRLVAVEPTSLRRYSGDIIWRCKCDCGKEKKIVGFRLQSRDIKSCGCLHNHLASERCTERWGEKHPRHKLTAEQVNDIRHRYAAGFTTQRELAKMYYVHNVTISRIVNGKGWKNLPGGPIMRMSPVTRAPSIRQRRRIKQSNEGVSMSKK